MITTIMSYKGHLTFRKFSSLIARLNEKKTEYDIELLIYKKLITLVIEMLENIIKYADNYLEFTSRNPEYAPQFNLSRNDECYYLEAQNPVHASDIPALKSRIDKINKLDERDLRELYRETITNGRFTEKGGAGLGFIEMAKITHEPLSYDFEKISGDYATFKLKIRLR